MHTDIRARGFSLTDGLRSAVEREAVDFQRRLPCDLGAIRVRLFDTNGSTRGGADKVCRVHARLGGQRAAPVATATDADLYRAIVSAFTKLSSGGRTATHRSRSLRRTSS